MLPQSGRPVLVPAERWRAGRPLMDKRSTPRPAASRALSSLEARPASERRACRGQRRIASARWREGPDRRLRRAGRRMGCLHQRSATALRALIARHASRDLAAVSWAPRAFCASWRAVVPVLDPPRSLLWGRGGDGPCRAIPLTARCSSCAARRRSATLRRPAADVALVGTSPGRIATTPRPIVTNAARSFGRARCAAVLVPVS